MLVLTRKRNEGIIIGGQDGVVRITVIEADKGKVRLGIEAPKGRTIIREELLVEVEGVNRLSALAGLDKIKRLIGDKGE
jgi:carbon storage regulator